jgi:Ca-activated chloride channel homolog
MSRLTTLSSLLLMVSSLSLHASDDGPLSARTKTGRITHAPSDIRVNVDMALVPVSVMDGYGRSVMGLTSENFRVFDGARQVPIVSFGRQDQPITVGLIFDCSRSMRDKIRVAREAARQLYQQLNPDDESFLVTVSDRAELKHGLTSDLSELESALLFANPDGSTSLVDGVYLGLQQVRKSKNGRRALVVVSDGGDNNSRYTLHELEKLAVESDTQIFAMGLHEHPQTLEELQGPALLAELCSKTGGTDFLIGDISQLSSAMGKVGVMLHNQYVLGYYPPDAGPAAAGKYRKIKVQLLLPSGYPPLSIHARAGYYTPR